MHQVDRDAGWRSEMLNRIPLLLARVPQDRALTALSFPVPCPEDLSDSKGPPAALMSVIGPPKSRCVGWRGIILVWSGAGCDEASKVGPMVLRHPGNPVIFPNVTHRRLRFVRGHGLQPLSRRAST
jgi:hypothetical protein